jgi:hypothetical protein
MVVHIYNPSYAGSISRRSWPEATWEKTPESISKKTPKLKVLEMWFKWKCAW